MKLAIIASALLLAQVSAKCENACSGHGECGTGSKCSCYSGFTGSDCSLRTCYSASAWVDSGVGDINGDGDVTMDIYLDDETGYSSELYSSNYGLARPISFTVNNESGLTPQQQDWDEAHFEMECSNKGLCNRKTGQCDCFPGYTGEGCQRTTCPGVTEKGKHCSGHGTCVSAFGNVDKYQLWDKKKTFKCQCDPNYHGTDCSKRMCPYEADPQQHQLVYTTSLQKISWGSFMYRYNNAASKKEVTSRIVDGDVSFTITVTDHFGDSWTTNAFTMKYNTRIATIGGTKVIFNYPTSYDFEAQKLTSPTVFEKATTQLLFTQNTKATDPKLHTEINTGLDALPHGACRDAMVWTQFVQRQGKTIEDFTDLTKVTTGTTACYSDVNTPLSRPVNDKYICEFPAGAWNSATSSCSSKNFTTKSTCELMGFQVSTADKNLDPYASMSKPNINGMDKRVEQAMPIFVKGTTTEDTIYSPYQCGRTTSVFTTSTGTGIVRRDGACIYIQTSNKVTTNYVVTYSYKSQLKSDIANWPAGSVYKAKKVVGRSAQPGIDIRDFTGAPSKIADSLVRITDVSAHRRVQTQWINGILPISNGVFGQAVQSTTSQIYPLRKSLFTTSSCASRGLCNENTGECECFKGYVGSSCTKQKSVTFIA